MKEPTSTYYVLSKEEKSKSLELFKKHDGNLLLCIRELFNNPKERGTTSKGRAVREFWIEKGLSYRTKVRGGVSAPSSIPKSKMVLTAEEESFIKKHYTPELTKKEVAKIIWPDESKKRNFFDGQKFALMSDFVNKEFSSMNLRDDAKPKGIPLLGFYRRLLRGSVK